MAGSQVTIAQIEAAEALLGLALTAAERRQMAGNIDDQIGMAQSLREVSLPNSAAPASRFDPRPPGFTMPTARGVTGSVISRSLPDSDEDIAFASVPELGYWIHTGQLTSRRLTEIYLARIAALDPVLKCWATVTADLALAEADGMDALTTAGRSLGPLHGLPYGLKDLFDTKGIATGWGAEPFRDRLPDADAAIVQKLRAAGAVLLGKTTLGALAYGDIWYGGTTRNPWNVEEGSSGSSAGSASATAAGLCAFSIGTETLGSITSPSQRCGTTGLRPTYGRVSRAGAMALCWSLDKVGPIARGVEDCALVLEALNGGDGNDRGSIDAVLHFDITTSLEGMKVGYLPAAFEEGATDVDRAALAAVRDLGVEVVPVALLDLPWDALMLILFAEAAAAFADLTETGLEDTLTWQDDAAWPNTFRKARFISAVDVVQADRVRLLAMQALEGVFAQVDAMVGPFETGPMLVASNFTGHPCLHLRAGFNRYPTRDRRTLMDGPVPISDATEAPLFEVPQGISLWGRLFDEGRLLSLGIALERALGVAGRRPEQATNF